MTTLSSSFKQNPANRDHGRAANPMLWLYRRFMLALPCLQIHNTEQPARQAGKRAESLLSTEMTHGWSGFEEIEEFPLLIFKGGCPVTSSFFFFFTLECFHVFLTSDRGEDKCCLNLTLPTLLNFILRAKRAQHVFRETLHDEHIIFVFPTVQPVMNLIKSGALMEEELTYQYVS